MKLKGIRYDCGNCGHRADVTVFEKGIVEDIDGTNLEDGVEYRCPKCGSLEVEQCDDVLETTREWAMDALVDRDIRMIKKELDNGEREYVEAIMKCDGTKPIGAFDDHEMEIEFANVFDINIDIIGEATFSARYGFIPENEGENFELGE